MPSLQRLQHRYPDSPFKLLLVDVMEPKEAVEEFIKAEGYDFTVLLDEAGLVSQLYDVRSHPVTFIIAPSGDIMGFGKGYREWDTEEMKTLFDTLVAQGASSAQD